MKILLALCLVFSGCSTFEIHDKVSGIDAKATSFLTKAAIKGIAVKGPDGVSRTVSGFQSDQVEALQVMADLAGAVAASAAKAAVKP